MPGRAGAAVAGTDVTPAVRSELIASDPNTDGTSGLAGTLAEVVYLGPATRYVVALPDGTRITVRRPAGAGHAPLAPGAAVRLSWSAAVATVLMA